MKCSPARSLGPGKRPTIDKVARETLLAFQQTKISVVSDGILVQQSDILGTLNITFERESKRVERAST